MSAQTVWVERTLGVDAPAPAEPAIARRRNRVARQLIRAVLALLAAGLLVRFAVHGWPEIRESLALLTVDQAPLLGAAVVAEALWVLAMSQVYRSALLAFGGTLRRPTALRVSMAAFTLSRILPGGGAAGAAVAARELVALGNRPLRTLTSMLMSWWLTMTALSALVFAGVAASVSAGSLAPGHLAAPAAALSAFVLGGGALVVATRGGAVPARLTRLVLRAAGKMSPAGATASSAESLEAVVGAVRVRALLATFAWGVAVWILDAAALWLALAAFGWHTDVGVLLIGYGVANLIAALPELTPGWLGVIETSVASTLAALGVPAGVAIVAVLAYRLVSYWLPTAVGIPAALGVLGRRAPVAQERS